MVETSEPVHQVSFLSQDLEVADSQNPSFSFITSKIIRNMLHYVLAKREVKIYSYCGRKCSPAQLWFQTMLASYPMRNRLLQPRQIVAEELHNY